MMRNQRPLTAVVGLALVGLLTTGCVIDSASAAGSGGTAGGSFACSPAAVADWTPEQVSNAQAIAAVALGLGLGQQGALVGITTAITESTLIAVNYGDYNSNGTMTTSRGLFQQMDHWGPLEDRLDPTKSATLFYTGGADGSKGLMDIPGWQQMSVPTAAQAVEQSQFSDGSNYARNLAAATTLTEAVTATCTATAPTGAGPGSVTVCAAGQDKAALAAQVLASPNLVLRAGREESQTSDIQNKMGCNTVAAIASMLTLGVPIRLNSLVSDHGVDGGYHPKGMAMDLGYAAGDPIGNQVYEFLYRNATALGVIQIIWAYPPTLPGIDPAAKCIQQNVNGIGATFGVLGDCDALYPSDISGHADHIHLAIAATQGSTAP